MGSPRIATSHRREGPAVASRKPVRIIFALSAPFSQRDYERYGVELLTRNGFEVWVWDLTFALWPHLRGRLQSADRSSWQNQVVFDDMRDACAAIRACPPDSVVITPLLLDARTLGFFRALSSARIPYMVTPVANAIPIYVVSSWKQRWRRAAKIINPLKLLSYVGQRAPLWALQVAPAAFAIREGARSVIKRQVVTPSTRVIHTHLPDYDFFLRQGPAEGEGEYALFLDNFLPFHSDGLYSGERPPVTPDRYYADLRRCFDLVEKTCALPVVVAAHPRSRYDTMPDYFGARRVVKGKTADLVRQSKFVIAHFSTSLSFAVMFAKPVLIVTTDELADPRRTDFDYRRHIQDVADALGVRPVNISGGLNPADVRPSIDPARYAQYARDYITMNPGDRRLFWQIIADNLKEHEAAR